MGRIENLSFGRMPSMEPWRVRHRLPHYLCLMKEGPIEVRKYKVVDRLGNTILLPFSFSSPFHLWSYLRMVLGSGRSIQ